MRKLLTVLSVLLVAHVAFLFVTPTGAEPKPAPGAVKVGIVFDLGGRGDKSFNDGAYIGGERAQHDLGAHVRFIEPGDGSDREAGIRLLAAEGMDLVIGVGFIFSDDLTQLAKEYPNTRFAGIDYSVGIDKDGKPIEPPPNLAALKFREEEGSFLVGALAAMTSKTGKVGFVGGMNFPLIHKFEAGYRAGVKYVCAKCTIVSHHASGSTGLGVFEAARQSNKLAIGVDADQYSEAPGFILTSMIKGVDVAVHEAVRWVRDGTFKGGIYELGLKQNGVGYIYDDNNKALIPDAIRARLEALKQEVIAGNIRVPSTLK
jgi:basic membrane protein A